ncbi:MAG: hypothetical protein WBH29_00650 [Bacilli bacterium]
MFPKIFAIIFNQDPELLEIAPAYFRIFFLGMAIFGIQMACQNIFMVLRQSLISLLLALLRKVILLVPFTLIFPIFFGIAGVYYAEPAADILAVIATFTAFRLERSWKKGKRSLLCVNSKNKKDHRAVIHKYAIMYSQKGWSIFFNKY